MTRLVAPGALKLDPAVLRSHIAALCEIGPRFAGGRTEVEARALISAEMTSAGLDSVREEAVEILAYREGGSSCEILPEGSLLPSVGLQFTASGDAEGDGVYLGTVDGETDIAAGIGSAASLEGKIAIMHTAYPYEVAGALIAAGVVGLIVLSEAPDGLISNLTARMYPPPDPVRGENGPWPIPGVTVEADAGRMLLSRLSWGPVKLRIAHSANYVPATSANVLGTIPGRGEERVVVGAHYDSQLDCPGACDNASGVAALIEIAGQLAETRPLRTVEFVAFADEEHGFAGSLDYCRRHRVLLERTVAMVNLDALGSIFPARRALWTDPSIRDFATEAARDCGWEPEDEREAGPFVGSDHNTFIDAGVPAAFFWRYPPGNPYYHTRGDRLDRVDIEVVRETAEVAGFAIQRLATDPNLDLGRSRPSKRHLDPERNDDE